MSGIMSTSLQPKYLMYIFSTFGKEVGIVLEKEPEVSDGDHVNFVREFTWYPRYGE